MKKLSNKLKYSNQQKNKMGFKNGKKYVLVDSKGKVYEKFKQYNTANTMKPKLEKIFLTRLTIKEK